MLQFFKKFFGSKHEKDIRALLPIVEETNRQFELLKDLSDDELKGKTAEFRSRIKEATQELEEEIVSLRTRLSDDTIPFEEREGIYDQIDALNKDLDKRIEETLNGLLPEAFAVVKEACRRLVGESWDVTGSKVRWDMVPFDVQLMGGIVLHQGRIAEMATGEGKTLVATLPAYRIVCSDKT